MATRVLERALPDLDEPIVEYLAGYVDAPEDPRDDVLDLVRAILESATASDPKASASVDDVLRELAALLPESSTAEGPLLRLDRVVDMGRTELSRTAGFDQAGGVDLALGGTTKARSAVDVKKLEKQEEKTRAKLQKRAQRDLYESSKLVENARKQETYEEMFLKVNPLENAANKSKNKDVHLPNIDLSFGSNRLLSGASLTLAQGRRYGLIGRNGTGKSTLLRNMALREVPIPTHISILYVEQEVTGDNISAIEAVLKADVWRDKLMSEEAALNAELAALEAAAAASVKAANEAAAAAKAEGSAPAGGAVDMPTRQREIRRDELTARLGEVQAKLVDMEAETGPSRAAALLSGLGILDKDQSKPTSAFSGGWRMRIALARALFCKPDLLMLDEPSNMLDLNAIAWLEDYLVNEWPGTLLVVSHDRSFLDTVATDIVHLHSERLDYYKGNFTQFYETRTERRKNQLREYEASVAKRAHLQAFIDRWRYNANRAAQAQSKIKELERMPEVEEPEKDEVVRFKLPETEKLAPPLLQLDNVTFGYTADKILLRDVNFDVTMESRIAVVGSNGAGKSTLMKLLMGHINPLTGDQKRNSRLRVGFFSQHHIDQLDLTVSPVAFLAAKFPGKSVEEYRSHLGAFGIKGPTGLQIIATLSGGQKSRVAFAQLSLMRPHVLLLDEPTNHLDIEGLDALIDAIKAWNGGVIAISHDQRFIQACMEQLWVTDQGSLRKFHGDVDAYKRIIIEMNKKQQTAM
ncbi:P-loop containing nucleoside triphosphate hydrolase protein [Tilletiopsis washingtonensis]|uniref:P-loop containing nucleoside triphosphate hydrolase protein n=1 Tax=Tilletiopsis washingtonensis TaxID=58919 RepID=A0A316Z3L6_9BASI|nr:P-loop containing nucleoside triphosphate hydrolase protein [Tilletiopsis washingtonensis]PWN96387.1 P-loop containing nucleoside triphosphate hydrolase protein [Tilletiopsis washingtonensis]